MLCLLVYVCALCGAFAPCLMTESCTVGFLSSKITFDETSMLKVVAESFDGFFRAKNGSFVHVVK